MNPLTFTTKLIVLLLSLIIGIYLQSAGITTTLAGAWCVWGGILILSISIIFLGSQHGSIQSPTAITHHERAKNNPLALSILRSKMYRRVWVNTHPLLIFAGLASMFMGAGGLAYTGQQWRHATLVKQYTNKPLTLTATIIDKQIQPIHKKRMFQTTVLELDVTTVADPITGKQQSVSFGLQCFLPHKADFCVGDTITIVDTIIKPSPKKTISGNIAFCNYLIKEGFLASIFLTRNTEPQLIHRPSWSWRRWMWNLRNDLYQGIMIQLSPQNACYFSLIFLGKKDPEFTDQLRRTFNYWGLSHYLARSGIHIILFILIWKFFFSLLPIHLNLKRLLLILICGTYGLLSWASTPFVRAYYSFLIIECGKLGNYQPNYLYILTFMCIIMLLFNPLQLFFLDFQLTFGLTFALVWLGRFQYAK